MLYPTELRDLGPVSIETGVVAQASKGARAILRDSTFGSIYVTYAACQTP